MRKNFPNLTGPKIDGAAKQAASKLGRMAMFAKLWTGSIGQTVALCRQEGMKICPDTAASYLRDPRFVELLRSGKASTPGSGVWQREELQRYLTRVAAGLEMDGFTAADAASLAKGSLSAGDNAGAPKMGQLKQTKVADRLRAAELLGRTLGAFLDKAEVSGDLKVSVVDLLDQDLKPVIEV
jgi:hypothetical protein